jgi:chemotaxis-related protein WspB
MQVLLLEILGQRYALETRHVIRVLPIMELTLLPRAHRFIAGIMNYHGTPVPVLDLAYIGSTPHTTLLVATTTATTTSKATVKLPADTSLATFDNRIILVNYVKLGRDTTSTEHLLGLRAEHVTGIRQIDPASIEHSGINDPHSPFLGRVIATEQPLLQLIDLTYLVPQEIASWLFDSHNSSNEIAC